MSACPQCKADLSDEYDGVQCPCCSTRLPARNTARRTAALSPLASVRASRPSDPPRARTSGEHSLARGGESPLLDRWDLPGESSMPSRPLAVPSSFGVPGGIANSDVRSVGSLSKAAQGPEHAPSARSHTATAILGSALHMPAPEVPSSDPEPTRPIAPLSPQDAAALLSVRGAARSSSLGHAVASAGRPGPGNAGGARAAERAVTIAADQPEGAKRTVPPSPGKACTGDSAVSRTIVDALGEGPAYSASPLGVSSRAPMLDEEAMDSAITAVFGNALSSSPSASPPAGERVGLDTLGFDASAPRAQGSAHDARSATAPAAERAATRSPPPAMASEAPADATPVHEPAKHLAAERMSAKGSPDGTGARAIVSTSPDSTGARAIASTSPDGTGARATASGTQRQRPVLASEVLREELSPREPGRIGMRVVFATAGAALVASALVADIREPHHLGALVLPGAVAALLAVLPVTYPTRALVAFAPSLPALAVHAMSTRGATLASALLFTAAVAVLPAALLFRAYFRASRRARVFVALGVALSAAWLMHPSGGALLNAVSVAGAAWWGAHAPALGLVPILLFSLLAFMGPNTTAGCVAWAVLMVAWSGFAVGSHALFERGAAPSARFSLVLAGLEVSALSAIVALSVAGLLAVHARPSEPKLK